MRRERVLVWKNRPIELLFHSLNRWETPKSPNAPSIVAQSRSPAAALPGHHRSSRGDPVRGKIHGAATLHSVENLRRGTRPFHRLHLSYRFSSYRFSSGQPARRIRMHFGWIQQTVGRRGKSRPGWLSNLACHSSDHSPNLRALSQRGPGKRRKHSPDALPESDRGVPRDLASDRGNGCQ